MIEVSFKRISGQRHIATRPARQPREADENRIPTLTASYGTSLVKSGKALSNSSRSASPVPTAPVTLTSLFPEGSSKDGNASIPLGPGGGAGSGLGSSIGQTSVMLTT